MEEQQQEKAPRKKWDLLIGIALVLFGGYRLYEKLQTETEWDFRSILTIIFIIYGGYLIYKYLKQNE